MRRKIKFLLVMKDGVEVRNIKELRENFNLEKVIEYYLDGKLQRWLKDRNYEDELHKILNLNVNSIDFNKELCLSLCIDYENYNDVDVKDIQNVNEKISKLNNYLENEKIKEIINDIAFTQKELISMINKNKKTIYLYNGEYSIPFEKTNIEYIGIGKVVSMVNATGVLNLDKNNIVLNNIILESKYVITVISKQSKNIECGNNIIYKKSNFEDYEVIIEKRRLYGNRLELGDGDWHTDEFGKEYLKVNSIYRVNDNTKELITNCKYEISAHCRYKDLVFYIVNTRDFYVPTLQIDNMILRNGDTSWSIFKVDIDGSSNKELISDIDFVEWPCEDNGDVTVLYCTDEYIVWRGMYGIYRCKHDGSEKDKMINCDKITLRHTIVDEYLIYVDQGSLRVKDHNKMYKFNINTKESVYLDYDVSNLISVDENIYYVKLEEHNYRKEKIIYELNLKSGRKKKLVDSIYSDNRVTKLKHKTGVLYYYIKNTYGNISKNKINL